MLINFIYIPLPLDFLLKCKFQKTKRQNDNVDYDNDVVDEKREKIKLIE